MDPQGRGRPQGWGPGQAALIALVALAGLSITGYAGWLLADLPQASAQFFDVWVYHLALGSAAAACLLRAAIERRQRAAWICFGLGLAAWTAGDLYWTLALADLRPRQIPYPSWADAGYLAALPFLYAGIALLIRDRVGRFSAASWLDGAVGALGAAAVATAALEPALVGLTKGGLPTVITNLAYPVGDVLLLAMIAGALVVTGLRASRDLALIGLGLLIWTGGDGFYLYLVSTAGYDGGVVDLIWPVGALMIAGAATMRTRARSARLGGRFSHAVPFTAALGAISLLVLDHFEPLTTAAIPLAGLTLALASVRLLMIWRENDRLMSALLGEATTDALTELGNRRSLLEDLEQAHRDGARRVFAMFDLDGFKLYNDGFGHPAGDALLRRLGIALDEVAGHEGRAYRLGGDEFCLLSRNRDRALPELIEAARGALTEHGEGFDISASCGVVEIPRESTQSTDTLRLADQRMYEEKAVRGSRSDRQTYDVLMGVLREREPTLEPHLTSVAAMAVELGHELQFEPEALDALGRAAELHDVGKIAIPEAILDKPAALSDDEWALMREHTLIGERILTAAPALRPVAALVRSSHERWDGTGYPDQLAGEEIPLGARVIAICDAYDAMTSDRPYQRKMTPAEALAELRRCAGTQFDPDLVERFCRIAEAAAPYAPEPWRTGLAPLRSA